MHSLPYLWEAVPSVEHAVQGCPLLAISPLAAQHDGPKTGLSADCNSPSKGTGWMQAPTLYQGYTHAAVLFLYAAYSMQCGGLAWYSTYYMTGSSPKSGVTPVKDENKHSTRPAVLSTSAARLRSTGEAIECMLVPVHIVLHNCPHALMLVGVVIDVNHDGHRRLPVLGAVPHVLK